MPSEDIIISVRNLSKTYRLFGHPGERIKQFFSLGMRQYYRGFTALNEVSFDVRKGETVGIIGRNGSGKSTLLQLICGILKPTSGSVIVNGRISALLELGAGFNPEFTGRENAYFQGALMGFTQAQMNERFDDIAAFADIGAFIDQSVRTYSSGMFVRLAFAVAISVDPDILVVDEALAVGDAQFQARCFNRLAAMRDRGISIVLVSHSTEQILRHCDRVGMLEHGKLMGGLGEPRQVVNQYVAALATTPAGGDGIIGDVSSNPEPFVTRQAYNPGEFRSGNGKARFIDFRMRAPETRGGRLTLELDVTFLQTVSRPLYGLFIRTADGVTLSSTNSDDKAAQTQPAIPQEAGTRATVCFDLQLNLCAGDYFFSIAVSETRYGDKEVLDRRHDAIHLVLHGPANLGGMVDMQPIIRIDPLPEEIQR
ncbi:MAG: ABC transporter ATP-binding protein [Burkholderiales bacterium]|nr:ABC transporter ATP-binding protein [Burkholderiales bacterium]